MNLLGFTLGRKGFLTYLRALGGSNIIKVVPSGGDASESRVTGKCLKVVCGANTAYLTNNEWTGDRTSPSYCELKVSPRYSIVPNLGALELSEALERVLTFTSSQSSRPVLQGVCLKAKDGKLDMVSADGYRLAIATLDLDGEGTAVIHRDELRGIAQALKRARRVRLAFETDEPTKRTYLILETELIRYRWSGMSGDYPDHKPLIPTGFKTSVSLESTETLKAIASLKVLTDVKGCPVDLTIGDGKVIMSATDDKGVTELSAETTGEPVRLRLDGGFFADALKACGGMVELNITEPHLPTLFKADGLQLVVMPMAVGKPQPKAEVKAEVKAPEPVKVEPPKEAAAVEPVKVEAPKVAETKPDKEVEEAVAEARAITEKPKMPRIAKKIAREAVAV
ncbi:DNA polymerase III beta subunit family protein [Dehalogenimonas alkenigignens]|uniref:DNA polymerase III beta subunit family protein n=1 Tax=Dehalogenimonas alkenigignens TaxID=1217799 RepID=A0A0W0GL33_9CHLR|nr:DNA polymerase III beta subunit family protein [Dehalogenimonas alkenigignens]